MGLQQESSGKTSDSLKIPLGETHRAQLYRYTHFCKFIQDESNSCSTTSHTTLQIFHFRIRRLENIRKCPHHANTYVLNRSRYFIYNSSKRVITRSKPVLNINGEISKLCVEMFLLWGQHAHQEFQFPLPVLVSQILQCTSKSSWCNIRWKLCSPSSQPAPLLHVALITQTQKMTQLGRCLLGCHQKSLLSH